MSKFKRGDMVRKIGGSSWRGTIVGEYSTELTPEGYAVESDAESGAVQIYPASALEPAEVLTPARMNGTALRKLDSLLDEGYRVNGVAIRRDVPGKIPKQGFVTDHGLVGWWPGGEAPEGAQPPIEWTQVARLIDAADRAKAMGFVTGTTNWAAAVSRYMQGDEA